jgi:hypothetical protein
MSPRDKQSLFESRLESGQKDHIGEMFPVGICNDPVNTCLFYKAIAARAVRVDRREGPIDRDAEVRHDHVPEFYAHISSLVQFENTLERIDQFGSGSTG